MGAAASRWLAAATRFLSITRPRPTAPLPTTAAQSTGSRGHHRILPELDRGQRHLYQQRRHSQGAAGGFTFFLETRPRATAPLQTTAAQSAMDTGACIEFFQNSTAANGTFTNNGGLVSGAQGFTRDVHQMSGSRSTRRQRYVYQQRRVGQRGRGRLRVSFDIGLDGRQRYVYQQRRGQHRRWGRSADSFGGSSSGGTSRVEVFGNANLDISLHNITDLTPRA